VIDSITHAYYTAHRLPSAVYMYRLPLVWSSCSHATNSGTARVDRALL